ncbi:hypothetical protein [Halocatena halophila]|uniref:hypothetical protein n=1 Tax=Halocatena halophila TaxID=2814576 RepID=UPI002ED2B897
MKEQDIVFKLRKKIKNILPSKFDVRTKGGDENASPPICILQWESQDIGVGGSSPYAGTIRDSDGNAIGRELHRYGSFVAEILLRSYSESERDELGPDLADNFIPYMDDSKLFNKDTFRWEVGKFVPKTQSVVERDWYEGTLLVKFGYVKRVEHTVDTLEQVQENIGG